MRELRIALAAGAAFALAVPSLGSAQEPQRRRQQPIEIRGQVPTPQVVTVRPREVPAYDRRVLVPNFFDRDFWPSILPGYELVPRRVTSGGGPLDCEELEGAPPGALTPRTGTEPATVPPPSPTGSASRSNAGGSRGSGGGEDIDPGTAPASKSR